ncbi:MAG: PilZ domain-containing protein [Planctomycetes bacterium]|nr:PilZ domain-containing protein [Planctomycetota bacterium]
MVRSERRRYRRLPVKLDLSCYKADSAEESFHIGRTINVSAGGLYFETATNSFEPESLLKVELSIPPTEGLLEFGGRMSGLAKVLRTFDTSDSLSSSRYGVAVEFSQSLKLHS